MIFVVVFMCLFLFTILLRDSPGEVWKIFRKSENLSWGNVVRSPIVSVSRFAAYRGKTLIFGLANPRLTHRGFVAGRLAVPGDFASAATQRLGIGVAEFELDMLAVALHC